MDDTALPAQQVAEALRGLARLNRASGSVPSLWKALRRIRSRANRPGPLRVLDVACGSADNLVGLALRARRTGCAEHFEWHACDSNPHMLSLAQARARDADVRVVLSQRDVVRQGLGDEYDVVMVSLFLHHLSESQVVALLRDARTSARVAVIASDLVRSPLAFMLVWLGSRTLTTSPVVRIDALRSVRAALSPAELRALATDAGMEAARVHRAGPARMLLEWPA